MVKISYHVILNISEGNYFDKQRTNEEKRQAGEILLKEIVRHVDVDHIKLDAEELCSFCEYNFEVDSSGLPLCCPDAQDEYRSDRLKQPVHGD